MSAVTDLEHSMHPAVTPRASRQRAVLETGLIVAGLAALLLFLGHHVYSDAEVRYQALSNLLLHARLDQSKYSLIGPLFSTPIWFVGGWLHLPHRGLGVYNWCVFALGVGALYWLLKDHIERHLLRTFLLILIAGSMFPFHVTNYYGEVFTAVCVAVGVAAIQTHRPYVGWPLIVLGVANTPATLVALGALVLVRVIETGRVRYLLAVAAAAALIGGENWIRRGSPFITNYEAGFGAPFFGFIAILFSFGKGLIFFAPGLFLPIRRALGDLGAQAKRLLATTQTMWLAFVVGLVAIYAGWWEWDGAWFWGPRFFLFASFPASLALAVRLRRHGVSLLGNLVTLLVLALSFWVGINGAIFGDYPLYSVCVPNNYAQNFLCQYYPPYSMLWYPFVVAKPLTWLTNGSLSIAYAFYSVVVFVYLAAPLTQAIVVAAARQTRSYFVHLDTRS